MDQFESQVKSQFSCLWLGTDSTATGKSGNESDLIVRLVFGRLADSVC